MECTVYWQNQAKIPVIESLGIIMQMKKCKNQNQNINLNTQKKHARDAIQLCWWTTHKKKDFAQRC